MSAGRAGTHSPTAPRPACRLIFVSNHLPLKVSKGDTGWNFEWDEDALIAQAKEGLPEEMEAVYVGCLPVEVEPQEQEVRERGRVYRRFVRIACAGGPGR